MPLFYELLIFELAKIRFYLLFSFSKSTLFRIVIKTFVVVVVVDTCTDKNEMRKLNVIVVYKLNIN